MLRADIAQAHLFNEQVTYGGYEFITRLAGQYRLGNVPQVLVKYWTHSNQRSRIHADAVSADQRRFRKRHFYTIFPHGTAEDYAALAYVADDKPFPNLATLERAGIWLARSSQTIDKFKPSAWQIAGCARVKNRRLSDWEVIGFTDALFQDSMSRRIRAHAGYGWRARFDFGLEGRQKPFGAGHNRAVSMEK